MNVLLSAVNRRQAGTEAKGGVKEEKLQKNDTGTLADTGIDL